MNALYIELVRRSGTVSGNPEYIMTIETVEPKVIINSQFLNDVVKNIEFGISEKQDLRM